MAEAAPPGDRPCLYGGPDSDHDMVRYGNGRRGDEGVHCAACLLDYPCCIVAGVMASIYRRLDE